MMTALAICNNVTPVDAAPEIDSEIDKVPLQDLLAEAEVSQF